MKTNYMNTIESLLYRAIALPVLFFSLCISLSATTWTSQQTGLWDSNSTWGQAPPPFSLDDGGNHSIIIGSSHRIDTDGNSISISNGTTVNINISGILVTDGGGITMTSAGATINILGGVIIFDNGGITITNGVVNFSAGGGVQHCNADFKVESGGTATGTGYIYTDEKAIDNGTFGTDITVCASTYEGIPAAQQDCSAFTAANGWDGCLDEDFNFPLLPVELIFFDAAYIKKDVQLQWKTETELNNSGFEIERSIDARNWDKVSFVLGHGTTTESQSYTYTDRNPQTGINYYRLKQLDLDGVFEYSKTISVKVGRTDGNFNLFPNPAKGSVTIAHDSEYSGKANFVLFDLTGKQVMGEQVAVEEGRFFTNINLESMPVGIYIAEFQAGTEVWKKRLVVK